MTREELVQCAHALKPKLVARAEETQALRHLTQETKQDLEDAGLARLLQPSRFGGTEGHVYGCVEILHHVGSACGATAWCLAQYIGHNYMVAQWPEAAQQAVWGEKPQSLVAGILIPLCGKAKKVDGGYQLTGRWPFVSGVNICDWCILSGMVEDADGEDEERYFLMPYGSFEIIDTWQAMGLKGSGSNDIAVNDVYIKEDMTLPIDYLKGGPTPGNAINTSPLYQLPCYMQFGIFITSATLGIAHGMQGHYEEFIAGHKALMSGRVSRDEVTQQIKVAEAAVCLASARALAKTTCDQIMSHTETGLLPTDHQRTEYRAQAAFIGRTVWRAANILWDAAMGRAVYESNPLALSFRDMSAASRHFTHNWDVNGAAYGRLRLGLPLDNPSL